MLRSQVLLEWALNPDPLVKLEVIRLLMTGMEIVGDDLILEQLCRDPHPAVSAEAKKAVEHRQMELSD